MKRRSHIVNLPIRAAAGAYIVNAGLNKLRADKDTQARVHGFASGSFPYFENLAPEQFVTSLGATEVTIGSALLSPFIVGDGLAGIALTAFAGGLLRLYMKTPGLREEGSVRPTQDGTAIAKDAWLAGIGLTLMVSSLGKNRSGRVKTKAKRKVGSSKRPA